MHHGDYDLRCDLNCEKMRSVEMSATQRDIRKNSKIPKVNSVDGSRCK